MNGRRSVKLLGGFRAAEIPLRGSLLEREEAGAQLALNPETIFEKIVLTPGMIAGGRNPATTTASAAASSAYSIMS
jgi:hypothetical protein